jgi:hypothetical protein
VIARSIWLKRNKVVYEGEFTLHNKLIQEVVIDLKEYHIAYVKDGMTEPHTRAEMCMKWNNPL